MKKQDPATLLRSIGARILAYAKNELCMSARFLAAAVGYAQEVDMEDVPEPLPLRLIATNGTLTVYSSKGLLDAYEASPHAVTRTLAHLLFHCLYRHFAKATVAENRKAWDAAADIAAEYLVDQLKIDCLEQEGFELRENVYKLYAAKCPLLTAEYLYEELKFLSPPELKELRRPFERDEHLLWYASSEDKRLALQKGETQSDAEGDARENEGEQGDADAPEQLPSEGDYSFEKGVGALGLVGAKRENLKSAEEDWKRIAERCKLEIETFAKEYGDKTADLRRIINVELKTAYDYREFLRKFMTLKEIMKEDLTQFDYIYYNLGLMMYGNVPFYDHLEYALDYSLEDFVIAIDSSGSVFYDLAVNFLEECYSIIAQATTTRRRINLHIIQCDAAIKEDVLITGFDDFTRFIKRFTLRGGGGTDFRPVFKRVDEMVAAGKLPNLKGIVYFTDGRGKYPEKPPKYQTAFIFYGNKNNDYNVPPWAMKLVIDEPQAEKKGA